MVSLTDNDHDMVIFLMLFVGEYFQRRYGNRRPIYNVLEEQVLWTALCCSFITGNFLMTCMNA